MWVIFLFGALLVGCGSGSSEGQQTPSTLAHSPDRPAPTPLTQQMWSLTGTLASGTVSGTVTLDSAAAPFVMDGHNLTPNRFYHVIAWDLTISPTVMEAQPIQFLPAQSTAEMCLGACLFDPRMFIVLWLKDGTHTLQLAWEIPALAFPETIEQWGMFIPLASELQGQAYTIVGQSLTVALVEVP